jgi:thymidylate synthase (FAD)
MGSDLTVVNAARVSFDKESEWEFEAREDEMGWYEHPVLSERDVKLINYLAKHDHFTPFTHPQITLRETVPIFVARQRFKHVVGFTYNEVSRRYVDDDPEFYTPEVWRSRPEGSVKQGSGPQWNNSYFWTEEFEGVDTPIEDVYSWYIQEALSLYTAMIDKGIAPEQARMILPQSMMTSYYVTGSLAAFARFYKQRIDNHAQKEIQELAKQVGDIIQPLFPVSWKALTEG